MDLQSIGFLAFLAPIALFFKQIREFGKQAISILWKTKEIPYNFSLSFYQVLKENGYSFDFDNYVIDWWHLYSEKADRSAPIMAKLPYKEIVFYKKFIPVFVSSSGGKLKVSYLKFTLPFEDLLVWANENRILEEESKDNSEFYIVHCKGKSQKSIIMASSAKESAPNSGAIESGPSKVPIFDYYRVIGTPAFKPLVSDWKDLKSHRPTTNKSKYVFTKRGKEILEAVKKWLSLQQWYEERNINYRRGLGLVGEPGSGKSSLVLEIAKACKIPIYVMDLSTMDNWELDDAFSQMTGSQAIILFEDIDLIFDGRKSLLNTEHCQGVTFDHFINKLSGVDSIKNKFVFVTTNHAGKLDPALTRPGRLDEIIDLPMLNLEEKRKVAEIMIADEELIEKALEEGIADSNAEFENRCTQISTNYLWNESIKS